LPRGGDFLHRHRAEDLRQLFRRPRNPACRLGRLQRLQHPREISLRRRCGCRGRSGRGRRERFCNKRSRRRRGSRGWRKRCRRRRLRLSGKRRKQIFLLLRRRRRHRAEDPGYARLGTAGRVIRVGEFGLIGAIPERVHARPPCLGKFALFRNSRLHRLGLTVKSGQPTMQAHSIAARSGQGYRGNDDPLRVCAWLRTAPQSRSPNGLVAMKLL
jgi:hypothetical protein